MAATGPLAAVAPSCPRFSFSTLILKIRSGRGHKGVYATKVLDLRRTGVESKVELDDRGSMHDGLVDE
jgi:hypothetical protein